MYNVFETPIFGIIITILFYNLGRFIQRKTGNPIFNPLLIAIISIIVFLKVFNISYESYKIGGDSINFFLGPTTIVLAVPLYKQFELFKNNMIEIIVGISAGVITSFISIKIVGVIFGANNGIVNSLIPKSITTPMGISLANTIGGIEAITVVAIICTGILGAIVSPFIFKIGNIKHPIARGIALGTSAHALGTTKAIEFGEVEGAMSGLSIGIAGTITVVVVPIIMNLI